MGYARKQYRRGRKSDHGENCSENNELAVLLSKLESHFSSEEEKVFIQLLENAIRESRDKADANKERNWSPFHLSLIMLRSVLAPPALTTAIVAIAKWLMDRPESMLMLIKGALNGMIKQPIYLILLFICGIVVFFVALYDLTYERRFYQETWVRHRLNASRLELLIVRFLSDSDYSNEAKAQFRNKVFDQLENNLVKFEDNMGKKS